MAKFIGVLALAVIILFQTGALAQQPLPPEAIKQNVESPATNLTFMEEKANIQQERQSLKVELLENKIEKLSTLVTDQSAEIKVLKGLSTTADVNNDNKYRDYIAFVLSAVTVVLAVLAILIAFAAIFGWIEIRSAAIKAATSKAIEAAGATAAVTATEATLKQLESGYLRKVIEKRVDEMLSGVVSNDGRTEFGATDEPYGAP